MSRPDLLRLSDDVLEDLTNRGTLRRARKELGAAALTVTEADDGTVTVSADDGTTCVLYANRPFAEWTCSCLAANNCRHIVRAILHYQAACSEPGVIEDEEPDSTDLPGQETPRAAAPGKVEPEAVFNPASITREHLRAALSPAALRRADQLAGQGLLAHVGSIRGISVVRIHHPTPVSVRFLAGADLNYVRCTTPIRVFTSRSRSLPRRAGGLGTPVWCPLWGTSGDRIPLCSPRSAARSVSW